MAASADGTPISALAVPDRAGQAYPGPDRLARGVEISHEAMASRDKLRLQGLTLVNGYS